MKVGIAGGVIASAIQACRKRGYGESTVNRSTAASQRGLGATRRIPHASKGVVDVAARSMEESGRVRPDPRLAGILRGGLVPGRVEPKQDTADRPPDSRALGLV